ncbi:MAG: exopolyphosphatase [Polyangia bacterium]|nr:exopolyphosphatase [Polyangia bacterium]
MRLITRSDFDGLACAALLEEIGVIEDYLFVHPKDVQDGKVTVTKNDVLANVPYVEGCGLWFDHHLSENERLAKLDDYAFQGASKPAPSCARVIYEYYGGAEKFHKFDESGLMWAVDKSDSADLTAEEIESPKGWILLSFVMDARTGLGRYKDYRISNHALMKDMIGYCRRLSIEEILEVPDVKERVARYFAQESDYRAMITKRSRMEGNVLVIDFRNVAEILSGNRFTEYAMFPGANVSIRAIWGREKQNVVFTVGHSIINRTCKVNIGSLMLKYGGGGHEKVGTCQIPTPAAAETFSKLIAALKE